MQKPVVLAFISLICASLLSCASQQHSTKKDERPNVLFIIVDDLNTALNCYGEKQVISPNIDQFAQNGIQFNRAYCQNPVCGASRASILSGLRPTFDRFWDYRAQVDQDAPGTKTLPQVFKENGYYTVSNGKVFHSAKDSEERSWSEPAWLTENQNGRDMLDADSKAFIGGLRNRGPFFEGPEVSDNAYPDGRVAEKSIADLKRLSQLDQPFFLAIGFIKPHLPFYAPKKYWDLYQTDSILITQNKKRPLNAPDSLKGSPEIRFYHDRNIEYNGDLFHRTARHGYYACISYVDALVGQIMSTLVNLELKENTIIVLLGDHGWNLGEHNLWGKHNTMHRAVHTPLIFQLPGATESLQSDALVEFVDIYPTLCELTDIPIPDHLQGTSFVPLLNNPKDPWKEAVYSRYQYGEAVITENYIYTKYMGESIPSAMLYDLEADRNENNNVVEQPKYQQARTRLDSLWDIVYGSPSLVD